MEDVQTAEKLDLGVRTLELGKNGFPLCIEPTVDALRTDVNAASAWVQDNKPWLDAQLRDTGAIVFRGFALADAGDFNTFLNAFPGHEGGYSGGTTQRNMVTGRVMESTVAPPDRIIPIHQEMAYSPRYPLKLAFFCEIPSPVGGETPICDMRALTRRMPRKLHDNVLKRGLIYWRHFRNPDYATGVPELDIVHRTWQQAFQTDDKADVEAQVRLLGSEFQWCDTGLLVHNPSPGFALHPETDETIWFNSIGGYGFGKHVIGEKMAALYEEHYGNERPLPFWVTYGDGGAIDPADIVPLYEVTDDLEVAIPWQRGDVFLLDNILAGHGRKTFEGDRRIRVSLLA